MVYDRATSPGRDRRGPPDQARLAVRGVQAGRRGADALVPPRLRAADDRRPAVQHLRPVPALGGRGGRRRDLHAALAGRRAVADLRRRDPDARPALRHRLRAVRRRCTALRCGRRADPQRGDRARCLGQRAGRRDRAGRRAHRPRRAHPPAERDRGPALRPDARPGPAGLDAGGRSRRGPRPGARLDGRADGAGVELV